MHFNRINNLLKGTIESVKTILPFNLTIDQPAPFLTPLTKHSFGVLIGLTGNIKGSIIIDGDEETFKKIGHGMFGMQLEGAMLSSFAGEFGNLLAGKLASAVADEGIDMDITPPTVLIEKTLVNKFDQAYKLPLSIENIGSFSIFCMVKN